MTNPNNRVEAEVAHRHLNDRMLQLKKAIMVFKCFKPKFRSGRTSEGTALYLKETRNSFKK